MTLSVLNSTSAYSSPSQVYVSKASNEASKMRQFLDLQNTQGRSTKLTKVMHTSIDQSSFEDKATISTSTSEKVRLAEDTKSLKSKVIKQVSYMKLVARPLKMSK